MPPGGTAGPRVAEGGSRASNCPLTHRRRHRRRAYHEPHQPKGSVSMYCPECGNDAGSAKFCPECGANLAGVQDALSGKTGAAKAARQGGGAAAARPATAAGGPQAPLSGRHLGRLRRPRHHRDRRRRHGLRRLRRRVRRRHRRQRQRRPRPGRQRRHQRQLRGARRPRQRPLRPGRRAFQNQDFEQGGAYFAAAAKVYAAAWKKQATDPARRHRLRGRPVLQRRHPRAPSTQIDAVLKANPDFQKGWLNKGIFLSHEAPDQRAERRQEGRQEAVRRGARPRSPRPSPSTPSPRPGKQADQSLQQLQQ